MEFLENFPFFSIMLAMFTSVVCSMLKPKAAKYVCISSLSIILGLSVSLLIYVCNTGESFVYLMGHFPAPWGNEIRAGITEALTACVFCAVALCAIIGGSRYTEDEIDTSKQKYFYLIACLLISALLALVYTNDLFTAYVFLEINTIAACGLIMIRHTGKAVASAIQYMVMSLLGSGLVLIGVTLLYTLTGHLLMSNIKETVGILVSEGTYTVPLIAVIGLITIGLSIKSGLYPFHLWIPDAYTNSAPSSSALLSGLASKGYIFLLIKIYYRVLGLDSIISSKVLNVVFICGIVAVIMGSVHALREGDIRRMSAFSSVSHIGYIFMCIGMGSNAGMGAALFHLYTHAVTKAMLFLSVAGVADVSGLRLAGGSVRISDAEGLLSVIKKRALENTASRHIKKAKKTRLDRRSKEGMVPDPVSLLPEEIVGVTEVFDSNVNEIKRHADLILRKPSEDSSRFDDTKGAGYRNWVAGIGYTIGALSIVGVPLFAGFASKIYISEAVLGIPSKILPVMLVLALSTVLMVTYFLRMVIQIYTPAEADKGRRKTWRQQKSLTVAIVLFVVLNLALGLFSGNFIDWLDTGLKFFG